MNDKHSNTETSGGRWLRVSLLALAALTPAINSISNYLRRQLRFTRQLSEIEKSKQSEVIVKSTQPPVQVTALQRLDELTHVTRKRTAEQAQQLQKLAQHWQEQALQLRKAMNNESRQRRELNKTIKQLRKTGRDWSQDLLTRGEGAATNVAAQSGKITHSLLERGSRITHDLTERGSKVTHDLTERGGKVTHDLTERGSKATRALVKRGDQLRHSGTFWTIFGFSLGMVAAATITIIFMRKRMITQRAGSEEASHIELPQDRTWNGASSQGQGMAGGEIRHLGKEGSPVATMQSVGVDIAQAVVAPANAAFVGVASTRRYYPIETLLEENAKDLVYFVSEDEAKAQGFSMGSAAE
jgi:hypothetical protein